MCPQNESYNLKFDYIIAGLGISGVWLSHYLLKENKKVIVFDKKNLQSASNVASGLVNPVTGRRVVTTWLADELLPFCKNEYTSLGEELCIQAITQKNILVFPSAPDLQNAFDNRMKENNSYIHPPQLSRQELSLHFNFPFNVYEISPCYVIHIQDILVSQRQHLNKENVLIDEMLDENLIEFKDGYVQYKGYTADKIIFANGISASKSKFWNGLPFVENKGQALIVEIKDMDANYIYKFGHLSLIPLAQNKWWVGSSNELSFKTTEPTDDFKNKTIATLKAVLKNDFSLLDHWASLRPATVERRPFIGLHPLYPQIAILNGMGSKGCSLTPWFAKQLTGKLINGSSIDTTADVQRFAKILSRQ